MRLPYPKLFTPLVGVLLGAGYGVVARLVFSRRNVDQPGVGPLFAGLSLAFLFLVPVALGVLTITFSSERTRRSVAAWIFLPWVSCFLLMAAVAALPWEGTICLVLAAPIFLTMSTVGGVIAGSAFRSKSRSVPPVLPSVVAALMPFFFAPVESRLPTPTRERTVTNEVLIDAPPEVVWRNLVRVPEIQPSERAFSAFHAIGIPRPLEASIDREGLGALRTARFAGGVTFEETITEWEGERRLGFDIAVDPDSIRSDVLDEHVRVGGPYFDVLHGGFVLERAAGGRTRLVLSSRHRLSTRLNAYAGIFSDAIMRDLQVGICRVIKARSEATSSRAVTRASSAPPSESTRTSPSRWIVHGPIEALSSREIVAKTCPEADWMRGAASTSSCFSSTSTSSSPMTYWARVAPPAAQSRPPPTRLVHSIHPPSKRKCLTRAIRDAMDENRHEERDMATKIDPVAHVLLRNLAEAFEKNSWHGPNLRGSVRGVTAEDAVWRPGPGRHNIHELVVHAAYWMFVGKRRLTGEKDPSFPHPGTNFFVREVANARLWKADVDLLTALHRAFVGAVAKTPFSGIPRALAERRARLVRGIAAHDVYHAGQIQILKALRASGGKEAPRAL